MNSSRDEKKIKACSVVGRAEKSLPFDPGSELLLLGGSRTRRAEIINVMKKKKKKCQGGTLEPRKQ